MILKKLINQIKQNGITDGLSLESKLNIEISNVFNVMFIFLLLPFVFIFRETPLASLLASLPLVVFVISFVLVRFHYYQLGRFLWSITIPTIIYFVAASLYNDGGTDGMAAKFLLIADVMLPFMVFSKKEWKLITPILLINLFYLITFNYANKILNIPTVHNVDTPILRILAILTVFIMFVTFFFYYKVMLTNSFQKLDDINQKLTEKNRELTDLNLTKNKLLSIVSHDLRGPLHSMIGVAELLHHNNDCLSEKELKEFAQSFYTTSKNTYNIVENLLSWSQSQMGGIKVSNEVFELNEFVSDTTRNYSDIAQQKNISIQNKIDNKIFVNADKAISRCVLQNIIANAIKFSHINSTITISAQIKLTVKGDFVSISISDEGVGMDSKTMENLFKTDKIKSQFGTNNEKGTGIGLVLCKEFIELNGGKISIRSTLGKGSKVSFTIPVSPRQKINLSLKPETVNEAIIS